jgi:beta-glucosidase
MRKFPDDFIFGAASSAFQIEGSPDADGKGPSVWDEFCAKKGRIADGSDAIIACDHYRRWKEDLDIAAEIGLGAYRFSISWSRIMPTGRGAVNQKGLDFYSRLVDGLLERGIKPVPNLFHWDLPAALQHEMGGFTNREIVPIFADYAKTVAHALGDRIDTWMTVNEPFEYSCFGHLFGSHAPGIKSPNAYLKAMHHVLLSHGEAVRALRAETPNAKIGAALSWTPVHPLTDSARDRAAAARAEAFMNGITFDPILKGEYPDTVARGFPFRPPVRDGDMKRIAEPVDFVGVNYYSREKAKANPFIPFVGADITGKEPRDLPESDERTAMGWEVYPDGLTEILGKLRDSYGNPPVYVTEFGSAWSDRPVATESGNAVHDERRIKYLKAQLDRIFAAREAGCDLKGCFVWSLLDNFEWAEGLSKRFGIVYVDYPTGKRIIKDSGREYARLIKSRNLDDFGGSK